MKTFKTITTTTEPQDSRDSNFCLCYFYVQQRQDGYQAIELYSDECYVEDLQSFKDSLQKEARAYAIANNIIGQQVPLNADEISINRLGHIKLILLYRALEALANRNEQVKAVFDSVFSQTTNFKCADNEVRELSGKDIAKAHEEAMIAMSSIWFGAVPEIKEVVQTPVEDSGKAEATEDVESVEVDSSGAESVESRSIEPKE